MYNPHPTSYYTYRYIPTALQWLLLCAVVKAVYNFGSLEYLLHFILLLHVYFGCRLPY